MFQVLSGMLVVAVLAAQAPAAPAPTPPPSKNAKTIVSLTGCVSRSLSTPGTFTFAETDTGTIYRLAGTSVRKYLGQRVQIVGAPTGRRLTIRGGLFPSPNVAAQAGAMDPTQAAMATQPGGPNSGTGTVALPEFRVAGVRALGSCQ